MTARKYDVICVGTAITDSIIRGFSPEPVSAAGYRAEEGLLSAGGEAVNESIAAAKLGLNTAILCFLGEDAAGRMMEEELKSYGVDTGLIVHEKDHPTPVTTIFVNPDGSRRSITNNSHRYNFCPQLYTECFADTKAVILGSLFRAPFNDPEIIHEVLQSAKACNDLVLADTKLPNFNILALEDIADSLPLIDYITPNEDEARYYTSREDPEDMAAVFLSYGIKNVIIKLGARGCYFRNNENSLYLPAYDIDPVDATGAGDNFIAGFVSEIINGRSAGTALAFANACGAVCTTAAGAGSALKNREQVISFMRKADSRS